MVPGMAGGTEQLRYHKPQKSVDEENIGPVVLSISYLFKIGNFFKMTSF